MIVDIWNNISFFILVPARKSLDCDVLRERNGAHTKRSFHAYDRCKENIQSGNSGGECTLNRKWLIQYLQELKKGNPDKNARFHVDTNGSILTKDYLDELVEAGMTDIGIDLKSLELDTFSRMTGVTDKDLARKYLDTAWNAVTYLTDNYTDRVFLGIGIPYNIDFISLEEVRKMGEKINEIDEEVQVCVLDYRPAFRRMELRRPEYEEMANVWNILTGTGLKTVICQTERGHIGPVL